MNASYPHGPVDDFPWHRQAEMTAQLVSARRGFAAHVLFRRPLNVTAARAAAHRSDAIAYRLKFGIPEAQ